MPMGCNCCTERPCCGNRLFRGPGSVDTLTLSLESRQTWRALTTSCSPVLSPAPVVTSFGNQDFTLTYQHPIPSSFLTGLSSTYSAMFTASEGWYVSDVVNLFQISGDTLWTGTKKPVSGRYFYARTTDAGTNCTLGFWFGSDQTNHAANPALECGYPEWYYFMGVRPLYYTSGAGDSGVLYNWNLLSANQHVPGKMLTTTPAVRAIVFLGFGNPNQNLYLSTPVQSCSPVIQEHETLYDYDLDFSIPASTDTPTCGGTITPGVYPSRIRQAQTFAGSPCGETNPLNTSLSSGSGTPPTALAALSGTHAVYEQLSLWVTISE